MSKFVKVEDPSVFLPTVEERLPVSCAVVNQLKCYEKFKDEMEILTYGENKAESLWLLIIFNRKDWGAWISISWPSEQYCNDVPEEVKQSLLSGEIFSWEQPFILTSLSTHIGAIISKLIMDEIGLIVTLYTSYLFHMTPEEALKLEISPPPGTQVKPLDHENGTPFIINNWNYTRDGTAELVQKSLKHLPSAGVFPDETKDQPVCGALTPGFGLVSMLHTDPEHRRKGYASLAMRFIFKELAKEGLQPCLISELENKRAVNFHLSLGLKPALRVCFIVRGEKVA